MGVGYKRFKKCIIRAKEMKATLFVICEASLIDISRGSIYSDIEGVSMARKLMTLWVRHGIQTIFTESREDMSNYIVRFYESVGKEYIRGAKNGRKQ